MWTEEYKKQYHKDYHKVWYEKNKEKRQKQIREYGKAHPADSVRRTQKYIANNKEKFLAYRKDHSQTPTGKYRIYTAHAKSKGRVVEISLEEFSELITKPCVYCGDSGKVGVDRVDNSIGYTKGNCAPCCKNCNYMKKNLSVEDFLAHVQRIARYNT